MPTPRPAAHTSSSTSSSPRPVPTTSKSAGPRVSNSPRSRDKARKGTSSHSAPSGNAKYTLVDEDDETTNDFLMSDVSPHPSSSHNRDLAHGHDSDSESDSGHGTQQSGAESAKSLIQGDKRSSRGKKKGRRNRNASRNTGGAVVSHAPSIMDGLEEPSTEHGGRLLYADSLVNPPANYTNPVAPVTPLTATEFLAIVAEVRAAIAEGIYPTLISQGSSGSYFCKNRAGEIVGVFKPKNEEPYGHLNPKWTKWIHKNLFPCCFGRSCIIPNLGYISEAAASFIDRRLELRVVPRTEVIYLASPTFYYSRKDWKAYTKGGELPEKVGSFQVFLKGYKDATRFFREGYEKMRRSNSTSLPASNRASAENLPRQFRSSGNQANANSPYEWSERARMEFQWGFERLAVLDYLIRNTDRGLDNWMVKYDEARDEAEKLADLEGAMQGPRGAEAPTVPPLSTTIDIADPAFDSGHDDDSAPLINGVADAISSTADKLHSRVPDQASHDVSASGDSSIVVDTPAASPHHTGLTSPDSQPPIIQVAAIDNGLAFPYKHPDRWRSYPFGWSYLPASRIPFSSETRMHVLHLLTSPSWWRETMDGLERLFRIDADFSERMWRKQRAVVRGEGYNLVECLRRSETGSLGGSPWGLVRRPVVSVYEDETDDLDEPELEGMVGGPAMGMRPGRRRSFVERQVGGGKRFVRKVKQRFETFARNRPCFENW